jgi:hypothetical protein
MIATNPNLDRVADAYLALQAGAGYDGTAKSFVGNSSSDSDAITNYEKMNTHLKVSSAFAVLEVLFASIAAGLCWAEVVLKKVREMMRLHAKRLRS